MVRCPGKSALALSVLVSAGCSPNLALHFPEEPGAKSYLVFLQVAGQQRAFAGDPNERLDTSLLLGDEGDRPLTIVYFSATLLELGVEAGRYLEDAAPLGRGLPPALASEVLSAAADHHWERVEGLDPSVSAFRLPGIDLHGCLTDERCLGLDPLDENSCVECFVAPVPQQAMPPMLPSFDPCPPNWQQSQTSSEAPSLCLPLPSGVADCPSGQMVRPSAPSCAPIGPACPAGDWPTPLPLLPNDRYVGTTPSGAPPARVYGTLAAAIAEAQAGDRILLAKGSYPLDALPRTAITIEGTCVAGSTLVLGTVVADGTTALRTVTLSGGSLRAESGSTLRLDQVQLEGVAFSIEAGASIVARYWSSRSATLDVRGRLDLDGAIIRGVGPQASGAGASIAARDTVVIGSEAELGFSAASGASLQLDEVLVEGNKTGVWLTRASTASLDWLVARRVARGLLEEDGSEATVSRLLVHTPIEVGIELVESRLEGSDVALVTGPESRPTVAAALMDPSSGPGCRPELTTAALSRVYAEGFARHGVHAVCAHVSLDDYAATGSLGEGFRQVGGELVGARWLFFKHPGLGVVLEGLEIEGGSLMFPLTARLSDLGFKSIHDVSVAIGTSVDANIDRFNIRAGARNGLAIHGRDTRVRVTEIEVEPIAGTEGEGACVLADALLEPGPPGLRLEIVNFELEDSPFGIVIKPNTEVTLRAGWFRNNDVAISLRSDTIDPRQLVRGVRFGANRSIGL